MDINLNDSQTGMTALHYVVREWHVQSNFFTAESVQDCNVLVDLLLANGADPFVKDNFDRAPIDMVR